MSVHPDGDTEGPGQAEVCQLDHLKTGEEGEKSVVSGVWPPDSGVWRRVPVRCRESVGCQESVRCRESVRCQVSGAHPILVYEEVGWLQVPVQHPPLVAEQHPLQCEDKTITMVMMAMTSMTSMMIPNITAMTVSFIIAAMVIN